ncbi:hypothetical protein PFICI_01868 [Pestalotiopsis fici W106-1]|uniref:Uncharacterized protein n=1 Tax=Pestalotiopsis fici (strain W106-1 / CGMCC3.15140) TaxID=1229662 RepID=W3XPZ7_PESFW|nr:uncharacterized protein PFICI_01868 [Pestalotiopsis fici W106-1]ETS88040.1 hypothetical protein PFICI_01868 [Pestalotiopsis fici W106-1]
MLTSDLHGRFIVASKLNNGVLARLVGEFKHQPLEGLKEYIKKYGDQTAQLFLKWTDEGIRGYAIVHIILLGMCMGSEALVHYENNGTPWILGSKNQQDTMLARSRPGEPSQFPSDLGDEFWFSGLR